MTTGERDYMPNQSQWDNLCCLKLITTKKKQTWIPKYFITFRDLVGGLTWNASLFFLWTLLSRSLSFSFSSSSFYNNNHKRCACNRVTTPSPVLWCALQRWSTCLPCPSLWYGCYGARVQCNGTYLVVHHHPGTSCCPAATFEPTWGKQIMHIVLHIVIANNGSFHDYSHEKKICFQTLLFLV